MTTTPTSTDPDASTPGEHVHAVAADRPAVGSRGWWSSVLAVPTARFALVVGLVALPVAVLPALWPLVVAVALVAVGDAVAAPSPWSVRVARELPGVVVLDDEVPLRWWLAHDADRTVTVGLADDLAPSLGAAHRRVRIPVTAGAPTAVTTTLRPGRRGRFHPTEMTVRVYGPLGLTSRQHTREVAGRLDVHPRFRSRREAELRITRGRILDVGMRSARALGRGTEFETLREYSTDDEFRRIDWAATARIGKPIVRTYRAERNQTVLVLLDTGRLMAGVVDGVPRLDHAMDAAMALTTVATRLGDRAGLTAFGAQVRVTVPPRGDRSQLARVTEAMFGLEPELSESAYEEVFGRTVALQRRRSLLVLLTELASEALPETLVPALPLLLRHHLVIVASVRDPELEAWRRAVPSDAGGAYRAAGAVTVRRARDRTAELLRGMGATVVDNEPDQLAGRLADAYLDMKATGRL